MPWRRLVSTIAMMEEEVRAMGDTATRSNREVGLVFDDRYLSHDTGLALIEDREPYPFAEPVPHPSSPALVGRAKQLIDLAGVTEPMVRIDALLADDAALLAYHTKDYLRRVAELNETGGDTGAGAPMGRGGERIARLAAGGTMAAVDAVMTGRVNAAYALVRPPGHHAMSDQGMGFCIFNNAVIAAHHARRAHGAQKVLILDWDVHHGNGTQDAFFSDPDVLFISLHQDDHYPTGWGAIDQVGTGAGEGFTVNIPLPAGTGNRGYTEAFDQIVRPIVTEFAPDLMILSAGQDANTFDPLARMALTLDGYRMMTSTMLALADACCAGRVVISQEGGYAPQYAPYCSAVIAETLVNWPDHEARAQIVDPYGERAVTMVPTRELGLDAARAIERVRAAQGRYWEL